MMNSIEKAVAGIVARQNANGTWTACNAAMRTIKGNGETPEMATQACARKIAKMIKNRESR